MSLTKHSQTAVYLSWLLAACGGGGGSSSSSTNSNTFVAPNASAPDAPVSQEFIDGRIASSSNCNSQSEFAQTSLRLVNEVRSNGATCPIKDANGNITATENMPAVGNLTWNEQLCMAALNHSKEMAAFDNYSHTGVNQSNPGTRITAQGYSWQAWAENIAAAQPDAQAAFNAWMNSTGHCKNIMSVDMEEFGAAFATPIDNIAEHSSYWTQKFANPL